MELIVLQGQPDCGKTTTINIVYYLLLQNGYKQVVGNFMNLGKNDFLDVLENGAQRIGIVSQGDWCRGPYAVKLHLKKLCNAGCSKTICAQTLGLHKSPIAKMIALYPVLKFISKSKTPIPSLERIDNYNVACSIMQLV